jgi:hypothetical protein
VCSAILITLSIAHADEPLDRAKAALESSDYAGARTALDQALATGTNGPDQVSEIYRLTGIVRGALGDAKGAQDAFARCLAVTPKATLPPGTSPKIVKPFAAALKANEPLALETATASDPPAITVTATDPLSMIAKLRVYAIVDGKPETTIDRPASERTEIALPAGARIDLRVAALDAKGNRLVEIGSKQVPIVIVGVKRAVVKPKPPADPPPPPPQVVEQPARSTGRPLYLQWWLWGGVAIAVGGTGAYFGIDAVRKTNQLEELNDNSTEHSFDEALAVERSARRSVLLANIGLISGGALAAGAAVLWLVRPRASKERLAITPVIHTTGGSVVLGGRF